jgi:penicillin-binding protein 1A
VSRKRKAKPKQRPRRRRRALFVLAIVVPLVVLAATAAGGAVYFSSSCDLSALRPVRQADNSLVYGANGSLIGVVPAVENRTAVPRGAISPWMPKATVAIEDRRFYQHGGIDPVGILRALAADVTAGHIVQGGSTITQELVRNLYLSREQTLQRKVVEACLAIKLARAWSRDRILTAYLNDVYYGNHAYGIEAAAETYFSVPASRLTLEQAALLAGLPQAPSDYDPLHNPGAALARRAAVLQALRRSGDITQTQFGAATRDRSLHLRLSPAYARAEPYFVGYVEGLLQQAYGAATVRAGGLKIYTTIQPRLQRAAVHALSAELYGRHDPAGAVVSIDPATGAIRAMAGVTPGTSGSEFNLATTAERQAGSTFKPIVLAAAVAEGMNPWATRYLSAPFYYAPLHWRVRTYDGRYAGPETVAAATLKSDNTVYARLALDVGPDAIVSMAQKLGVQTQLQATPSLALGTGAVTPLDMASVYATLAAGGVYSEPLAIRRVVFPGGKVGGGWGQSQRTRVVPDWVAATVTRVLEENMLHGTGVGAHLPGRADAGKTGTTDNYADAWFCGYTPSLEATVWIGYPRGEIPMLDVHGAAVSGPTLPATTWRLFMERAVAGWPNLDFSAPVSPPQFHPWADG